MRSRSPAKQRPIRYHGIQTSHQSKAGRRSQVSSSSPKSARPAMAEKPYTTAARKTASKAVPGATPKKVAATVTLKTVFEQLAEAQDMPKKQALAMAAGMVDLVTGILKAGDRVRLNVLGILEVKDRPARMGRNPATGAAVQIAASKKIAFRAAKELKEAV
jgi:DNA-binding protein HU-beta